MPLNTSRLALSTFLLLSINLFGDETSTINVTVPTAPSVNVTVPQVELVVDGQKVSKTSALSEKTADVVTVDKEKVAQEQNSSEYDIIKGQRYPPNYFEKKVEKKQEKVGVGEVENDRVAAYLQTKLISQNDAVSALKAAGFSLLATYKVDKKGKVIALVFNDEKMVTKASTKGRGFAANLRLLIDKVNGQISITNPIYRQKAFLQDDYDDALAKDALKRLRENFEGLQNSKDVVKFIRLPRYKFMNGMPVYEDMITIKEGSNAALLAKAKHSKKVVFEQKLENGSILIGIDLGRRTKKFVKKIGYQNGELLPYPVLIEDGKAYALAPKYYIAVMYPLLSMSEFMTIATVPGAISKDLSKIFR